jgi:hypothetical protein
MLGLAVFAWTLGASVATPSTAAADSLRDSTHAPRPAASAMEAPVGVRRPDAPRPFALGFDALAPLPRAIRAPSGAVAAADTAPPQQRRSVEVSEWYERRLLVHRVTAYVVPALFAYQYYYGDELYDASTGGDAAPENARDRHRLGRTLIVSAFAVNAVTGAWNWWDNRATPEGRGARTLHALSMLAATGGFAYAGVKLAGDFDRPGQPPSFYEDARRNHRNVALASMAVTLVSGVGMWIANR